MPRFRCGRLILKRNGELKKIRLDSDGGVRYCVCDYRNMNFYQIHNRLIKHFELSKIRKCSSNSLIFHFSLL